MKQSVGKRSLQKPTELPLQNGTVTVGITRKYNVAQYETLDVTVSVTASSEPGETQKEATQRIFEQLKEDSKGICSDFYQMARTKKI
jgi:hypothetical protein